MSGPAVVSLGELVPLMYRARWLRSFLSGQVSSREESPDGAGWESGSLHAAPGGRYRAETVDEDGDRELVICDGRTAMVPFGELLMPSLLLAPRSPESPGRCRPWPARRCRSAGASPPRPDPRCPCPGAAAPALRRSASRCPATARTAGGHADDRTRPGSPAPAPPSEPAAGPGLPAP